MPAKKPIKENSTYGLKGVGKQTAYLLSRLDIHSVADLLWHLPVRYQDRTQIQSIRYLTPDHEVVLEGEIKNISKPQKGRTKLLCELHDQTGVILLRFFHILSFQKEIFKVGTRLRCFGQARLGIKGYEMSHPEFVVIRADISLPMDQNLTPIYPATEGVSQYILRKLTTQALQWMEREATFNELLPAEILQNLAFPTLKQAIQFVHRPPQQVAINQLSENKTLAQQRLIFEELLTHRISLLHVKQAFQSRQGIALHRTNIFIEKFLQLLPFQLTAAQQRVNHEINLDMSRANPMLRLVQGDVGSGKTVLAALAMLQSIENGFQAAMMAPTELLAEQHYRVFKRWLEPLGINIIFLSGNVKSRARAEALESIQSGAAQIILGTHALFQENVNFAKLALVVIDEQHRFGVQQRALFRDKGMQAEFYPHQLVMTATPIPRTLAMSFYADLDVSSIDELPPGRTPIMTSVLANSRRDEVMTRIHEACKQGRQVYWVCTLIEESEVLTCQAATQSAEELQHLLPELKIGLIHGRMSSAEKESTMRAFQEKELHLLVATTVIEVGVDVPNASVMVIENAERMGLSQLHQLRGRVGRGSVASYCVLLYQHPLSPVAIERLKVMRETTDGFKIAQRDLELRGPGEVLGTRQTGELTFKVADLIRDSDLLPAVHQAADLMLREHPSKISLLIERWMGKQQEYSKV